MARLNFIEPALVSIRSTVADSSGGALSQAKNAYAGGDFQRTLDLLENAGEAQRQSADFLAAHALFRLSRFREAESKFEKMVSSGNRQFKFASEWGLLMSRLAQSTERGRAFKAQLEGILAQPEHPFHERAKSLSKTLNEK